MPKCAKIKKINTTKSQKMTKRHQLNSALEILKKGNHSKKQKKQFYFYQISILHTGDTESLDMFKYYQEYLNSKMK